MTITDTSPKPIGYVSVSVVELEGRGSATKEATPSSILKKLSYLFVTPYGLSYHRELAVNRSAEFQTQRKLLKIN